MNWNNKILVLNFRNREFSDSLFFIFKIRLEYATNCIKSVQKNSYRKFYRKILKKLEIFRQKYWCLKTKKPIYQRFELKWANFKIYGGDEENRTPVQKYIPKNFSECSQLIFIRRSKFNWQNYDRYILLNNLIYQRKIYEMFLLISWDSKRKRRTIF